MAYHFEVARKIAKTLTTEQQGRDLFICVYEDIANHSVIELDFLDCEDIDPEFFEGFINASHQSIKLPLSLLEEKIIFSGLRYSDFTNLHNAILAAKHEKDTQTQIEEVLPELRSALTRLQKMGLRR
jgi:hypothetical protein